MCARVTACRRGSELILGSLCGTFVFNSSLTDEGSGGSICGMFVFNSSLTDEGGTFTFNSSLTDEVSGGSLLGTFAFNGLLTNESGGGRQRSGGGSIEAWQMLGSTTVSEVEVNKLAC
ncbi:hypothetical protein BDR05DRAFT_953959 [Suillus weaverae]|nr:hypothetical protein BDR05DRAFT_953959 [Suillus weaverae]